MKTAGFATITLADMSRGEAFGVDSGLRVSELRAEADRNAENGDPNWWAFSREYMKVRWRTAAAKTRVGLADNLATVAIAMAGEGNRAPLPEEVRLAVRWAVVPNHAEEEPPLELRSAGRWLAEKSLPLSALQDTRVVRDVHYRLAFKLDDSPAAAETYKRRRRGFNTAMEYAIQEGCLERNPLAV